MNQTVIREANLSDIKQIQEIYAYHVLNGLGTFEETPPSAEEMAERMQSIKQLNYPFIVAIINDQVAGYCYANYYRQRSAYRFTVEDSVYINHKFQGQGVGALLLAELIKKCTTQQFKQMVAVIGDSNNLGSINLHKKFGFEHTGKLIKAGYKFDQWVDVVFMQLEL